MLGYSRFKVVVVSIAIAFVAVYGTVAYRKTFTEQRVETPAPVAENIMTAGDQYAGKEIQISSLSIQDSASLVVQKDSSGVPGAVIASVTLVRGTYENLRVTLSEEITDKTVVYATLYSLVDGVYDPHMSIPLTDKSNNVVSLKLKVVEKK